MDPETPPEMQSSPSPPIPYQLAPADAPVYPPTPVPAGGSLIVNPVLPARSTVWQTSSDEERSATTCTDCATRDGPCHLIGECIGPVQQTSGSSLIRSGQAQQHATAQDSRSAPLDYADAPGSSYIGQAPPHGSHQNHAHTASPTTGLFSSASSSHSSYFRPFNSSTPRYARHDWIPAQSPSPDDQTVSFDYSGFLESHTRYMNQSNERTGVEGDNDHQDPPLIQSNPGHGHATNYSNASHGLSNVIYTTATPHSTSSHAVSAAPSQSSSAHAHPYTSTPSTSDYNTRGHLDLLAYWSDPTQTHESTSRRSTHDNGSHSSTLRESPMDTQSTSTQERAPQLSTHEPPTVSTHNTGASSQYSRASSTRGRATATRGRAAATRGRAAATRGRATSTRGRGRRQRGLTAPRHARAETLPTTGGPPRPPTPSGSSRTVEVAIAQDSEMRYVVPRRAATPSGSSRTVEVANAESQVRGGVLNAPRAAHPSSAVSGMAQRALGDVSWRIVLGQLWPILVTPMAGDRGAMSVDGGRTE
ncbi:hypothetical protein C8Q76DRAFT_796186 [Earliella scabrosa]|nr:hypothetical protein C8Q76DRAFT_796186 [Earliella scabrosa]